LLLAIGGNTIVSRSLCDVFIEPPDLGNRSAFDLSDIQMLYDIGYSFVVQNFQREHFVAGK
jgi:hypothetical protein